MFKYSKWSKNIFFKGHSKYFLQQLLCFCILIYQVNLGMYTGEVFCNGEKVDAMVSTQFVILAEEAIRNMRVEKIERCTAA